MKIQLHQCLITKTVSYNLFSYWNCRFLTVRNIKRVAEAVGTSQRSLHLNGSKFEAVGTSGLHSSHYRYYSKYISSSSRYSYLAYKPIYGFCKSNSPKTYHVISASNRVTHRAQVAWKRLSQAPFCNAQKYTPITRLAQATSLALSRSYLVVPSIFALTCGNVTWSQASANSDSFQQNNTLYMHAQDSHAFLISLLLSTFEGVILLLRAIYLTILFSPSIMLAPFADSFGLKYRKLWLQVVHRTLEKAGPAFIKWGQWAATRPDLFPKDLCTELSKLHTKAPEHSFAYTKKTIEKAFGRKLSEIFENFEEVPVASGSIAQIHRASLRYRYRGRVNKPIVVAVKVRHPGVGNSIRRDFQIINLVAKISTFIPALKWLRLDESVQQFAVFMMSQVDLAREAAQLSRFNYNFRRWKDVSFPKPVYPLVHPAVLVETFEPGESVAYYVDELDGHERLKRSLAHIGTHALLKMLLVSGNCCFLCSLHDRLLIHHFQNPHYMNAQILETLI